MSDSVSGLFSEFWEWRLQRSPEFATMAGCKLYNARLEDFTEQRFEEDLTVSQVFLARAAALLETMDKGEDRDNLQFFQAEVGTFVDGFPHRGFYFPINYMEGVHVDFQRLADWASLTEERDYQDLLARYRLFPAYVQQIIGVMRAAIAKGLTNHAASMKGVVETCRGNVEGAAEETVFFKPFLAAAEVVGEEAAARLQGEAVAAVAFLRDGFLELAEFLATEYLPACRPNTAVTSLPGGAELYSACLRFHTSTDLTAEEIHQMGVREVDRIEGEMRTIVAELGLQVELPEFAKQLREDKSNFFGSAEELLAAFDTIIRDRVEPQLTKIFKAAPTGRLEITSTPIADYPAAFYIAGTPDGSRPSKLFVNTFKCDSQPRYEMVSLSLHEACPGHHLQGDYIQQDSWPDFRKVMEDRAYSQAPTRFPINTAYVEGWGLYSETLGHDLGLYTDPMDRYGHLSEEIFRACRLVVDTGLHALGWSRAEAVEYMLLHTAASRDNIVGEVDRYVTWPGQAVGYKIGQMKIIELRRRTEAALGERFDIKEFHEVVLKAAGPLHLLETKVDEYIKVTTTV